MEEIIREYKTYEIGNGAFNTQYSSEGSIKSNMITRACFAETLRQMSSSSETSFNNEYHIKVYKVKKGMHCAFVSLEQMKQWLNVITDLISFKWEIEEEEEYYVIKATVEDTRVIHLFILTCIRYIYEFPFSCLLLWAFKIKDTYKEFSDVHILNIISVLFVLSYNINYYGDGHSLPFRDWKGIPYPMYDIENLRKRLNSEDYKKTTCLFELCGTSTLKFTKEQLKEKPLWSKNARIHFIDYWTDFSNLDKEYPNILKMYNFILSAK